MNCEPDRPDLRAAIKALMVEILMLPTPAAEIGDDQPLFGPGGLGLDSVDALQLVVALDKHYGLRITDAESAKGVLQSVAAMAAAVANHQAGLNGQTPGSRGTYAVAPPARREAGSSG